MVAIEAAHALIDDSTVLYVPDLSIVVVEDVSRSDIHLASIEPGGENARFLDCCTRTDRGIAACHCQPITNSLE